MLAFCAVLQMQTLTLSGGPAMEHLNGVCEQRVTNRLMAQHRATAYLELGQCAHFAEVVNGLPPCWTVRSKQAGPYVP